MFAGALALPVMERLMFRRDARHQFGGTALDLAGHPSRLGGFPRADEIEMLIRMPTTLDKQATILLFTLSQICRLTLGNHHLGEDAENDRMRHLRKTLVHGSA